MEKRQFHRVSFSASATLKQQDSHWPTKVIDISLQGALIEYPDDFEGSLDSDFQLEIEMQGAQQHISAHGQVVHNANHCLGFHVIDMDLLSMTELRRIVELNLGDDTLLHRNLQALADS